MAKRILIVDDDMSLRKTFSEILAEYGYEVLEAASGKEALDKIHKEKPDVVLLDTVLPDMDGNEVCTQVKNTKGTTAKIIVYTGVVDAIDADKARKAGADDYVVKTSDLSCLLEAVKKIV